MGSTLHVSTVSVGSSPGVDKLTSYLTSNPVPIKAEHLPNLMNQTLVGLI